MIKQSIAFQTDIQWIKIFISRWWYLLPVIDFYLILNQLYTAHYLLVIISLCVGIGLFIIPSFTSSSIVAKGWRWMVVSWAMLIIRQVYFIATNRYGLVYSLYDYIHLFVVYTPPIIFIARTFYSLPFMKRSRVSTTVDWFVIGCMTTIIIAQIFDVPPLDVIFVGGDIAGLYAIFLNYQQRPNYLRAIFLRALKAMMIIIISDLIWIISSLYDLNVFYFGPLHIFSWLYLSRVALYSPEKDNYSDNRLIYQEKLSQQLLGVGFIVSGLLASLFRNDYTTCLFIIGITFVVFIIEIWESNRLHRRLNHAREQELSLRLAADKAQAEESRLRYFIQSLGHDLKAPIVRIDVCLEELYLNTDPDSASRRYIDAIDQARDILQRRIGTMLDVARKVQSGLTIIPTPLTEIEEEATQNIPAIQRTYKATHIPVSFVYEPGTIAVDVSAIGRALENLIVNAIKVQAHQASGSVTVSIQSNPTAWMIMVDDEGPGFEFERLAHHETIESVQKRAKGSHGLGLIGVRAVVGAMGGTIHLENRDTGGARFTITIPT